MMEYTSCNDIWLVLIESTCAYTWDEFKVKIVPCDQAFQHIDFCALLFPKESILAFLKRNLICGFGLKGGNFLDTTQKKRCFGFATYV